MLVKLQQDRNVFQYYIIVISIDERYEW